jgi:hypothetical protein
MKCREIQNYYWEHQARALPPRLLTKIDEHLASCPECARHFEACRGVDRQLAQLGQIEPSPHFDQRLQAKLDAASGKAARPARLSFWLRPQYASALAVILIGIASLWIGFHHKGILSSHGNQDIALQPPGEPASLLPAVAPPLGPTAAPDAALQAPANTPVAEEDQISEEDMALIENLELLQNYELLKSLDSNQNASGEESGAESIK